MPTRSRIVSALLLVALLMGRPLFATETSSAQRFCVDAWGTEDGLPQNSVISMIQSRDGYLWFGTLNGLVRFDGIRFSVFDESNTEGLKSSRIVKVFEDSQRNLWLGTETAGAALIKNGHVVNLDLGLGRPANSLSICEDPSGAVWLYTVDGELGRFQNQRMDVWTVGAERFSRYRAVIAEKSGLIWVGWDQSLMCLDPKKVSSAAALPQLEVLPIGKLDFLLASKLGGHWRMADGLIQRWKGDQVEQSWVYPWPYGTTVTAACETKEGHLIVGTLGEGVFWFDAKGKPTRISKADGLSANSVLSLHVDNEGSLWVGLDGGGLNRVTLQLFEPLAESIGLTVQSAAEDADGGLWFSSNNEGIAKYKEGALKIFGSSFGPMNRFNMRAILVDRQKRVWAGAHLTFGAGLFQLRNGAFQPVGIGAIDPKVSAIFQDRAEKIWVGTQGGLARWDEKDWKVFTTRDGLSANLVRAIADDSAGNLWIGTERGGLNRFRDGKFTAFRQSNGFPSDNISSLYVDAENVLWVGTFSSGLVRFQNGKWTHYTIRDGLLSNGIDYLIEDDQGCFWIGSNTGLMRVSKKALNDFATGVAEFVPCRGFSKRDGLPASECTLGSQPAACRTRDGKLWFPTVAGLVAVNPKSFHADTNPPPVMIESIQIEGEKQNTNNFRSTLPEKVTVAAGKQHFEIQYTSLNLSAPESVRFKYRLEGHEADWIEVGNSRVARYSQVPPGEYVFHVAACNEDGVWNEKGSRLAIVVLPPFWRTWWFLTLLALGLLALIVAIVHFISTQKLQRQLEGLRQQQALEKERARIARDIHDQLGASLTQVSLLGEMVESDKDSPEEVEAHARQISQTALETSRALDEIVWTVNPSNDTLDGLINYICKHAQEYLAVAGLRYRLEVPADLPTTPISPEARHNIFLAAKEAVTNVVRHARASEVWIRLHLRPTSFTFEIEDNGRGPGGAKEKAAQSRNGLSNMRKRMEDVGGEFVMEPGTNGGTRVRLTAPLSTH